MKTEHRDYGPRLVDYADKSQLSLPLHHAEKLAVALAYLGANWCLANPSTLEYTAAAVKVPNLPQQSSALAGYR